MLIDTDYIVRIRRELHQVPEIGFDLPKTLSIVRRELEAIGLPYTESYGDASIVATLNQGKGNKTIALRADMDALPIQEQTGLPFASTIPGQMHACGHDCHTAMLLGTAKALKGMENEIACCVKFVFQACEEGISGAKRICEDGFMDQVDMIIGCHISTNQPVGTVMVGDGCTDAACQNFRLFFEGKTSHVARPHMGIDAIAMAVRAYTDIQIMRARELDPFQPVVVGIGQIHGGTASNIVCDHVMLHGTIRTLSDEVSAKVFRRLNQICENIAKDTGGRAWVESETYTPCVVNAPSVRDALRCATAKCPTVTALQNRTPSMGSEDFAYYLQHKPGAMFNIGVAMDMQNIIPLHNDKLIVNEDGFEVGVQVFVQFVLDQM